MQDSDKQEVQRMITQAIATAAQSAQYTVNRVAIHTHNNIDSPNIPAHSVVGMENLPGTGTGVISQATLQGQVVNFLNVPVFTAFSNPQNTTVFPIPIIYGSGSVVAIEFTGSITAGATSGTLTTNWLGDTGVYAVQFGNFQEGGEIRNVTLTNGATTATWTPAVLGNYGVDAYVNGTAAFNGGDAPFGTIIAFVNGDASPLSTVEIWLKVDASLSTARSTWYGVSLDLSVG